MIRIANYIILTVKIKKVTYKKSTKKISVKLTKIKKAKKYKIQISNLRNLKRML